jgi:putative transferase (TIGR04331 family)
VSLDMSKQPRYLITTADERTWKFDRPVIFLGEWCKLYDRRHIWQDMDAIVAAPYVLGKNQYETDIKETRALEDKLFLMLCNALNKHHGTHHGARFWRIVLGHWLRRYIDIMLNRIKTLEQCLQAHQISGTTAYANDHYALTTLDTNSAIWAFNDNRWNNALTVRILDLLGEGSIPVEFIEGCASSGFHFEALATSPTLKRNFFRWGYSLIVKLGGYLVRDSDAFIINSYLPKKQEINLQLALGQFPQLWRAPKLDVIEKPDCILRKKLANQFLSKSDDNLGDILGVMAFELLPVCYLEGFSNIDKLVKQQPWPKSPKFIFTSSNFETDEVFKLWAATKVESGITYITGQHGNNYGTYRYMDSTIEEVTADKFITWGWTDGLPQHTPAFIFKTSGQKTGHYNQQGGLLLIELCHSGRDSKWDRSYEFLGYFKEQLDFVGKLIKVPKKLLTIRLHQPHTFPLGCEISRWQTFDDTIRLEFSMNISVLIAQSRLVVYSYDSTGILETLSQNIPTLAFWKNGLDHLRESAKPYYQLLVDAGIVHFTPESVAQKVNDVWDNVDEWWWQNKVQDARNKFCNRYARQSKKPVRDLKKLLNSDEKSK